MFYVIKDSSTGKYWSEDGFVSSLQDADLISDHKEDFRPLQSGHEFLPLIYENHYGIRVCSEVPITGVIANSHIAYLIDAMYYEGGINLTEIERCADCRAEREVEDDDYEECDICMTDGCQDTWIIGDWEKDKDDLWSPDKDGDHGYAAIVREFYTQVVFSKTTQRCKLCSPCYPGQGDLGSTGKFLAYDLPEEMYG